MDVNVPRSYSEDYNDPVQLPYPINTAGAEDSAFIMPNGNELYFFFTPDVRIPAERQLLDGVTGIYYTKKINETWAKPQRIILQEANKLSLDGCEFVLENKMWFCSAREEYEGINWFTAELINNQWQNWKFEDFGIDSVGELHIVNNKLYFHSDRASGMGGLDIWVAEKINEKWQEPKNLESINTLGNEGWPFISVDENELWFSRDYGIWRAKRVNDSWSQPELMFSPLAGEVSLDNEGHIYFTHHFYKNNTMIEADIYFASKKN
jgi:hypothetical protein